MVTLLDGDMGFELQLRGVKVPSHTESIWSAMALIEEPDAVVDIHVDYLDAGADVMSSLWMPGLKNSKTMAPSTCSPAMTRVRIPAIFASRFAHTMHQRGIPGNCAKS